MLFRLIRCTRLLQFHKESGLAEDENVFQLRQLPQDKRIPPGNGRFLVIQRPQRQPAQGNILVRSSMAWSGRETMLSGTFLSEPAETENNFDSPASRGKGK